MLVQAREKGTGCFLIEKLNDAVQAGMQKSSLSPFNPIPFSPVPTRRFFPKKFKSKL